MMKGAIFNSGSHYVVDFLCKWIEVANKINGSQLAIMKKYIPNMSLPLNAMVEAVGLIKSNYT